MKHEETYQPIHQGTNIFRRASRGFDEWAALLKTISTAEFALGAPLVIIGRLIEHAC